MAIFRKPTCDNLKKRNRAMTRIDSQDDDERDSMVIYQPKRVKDSSIESLYDDEDVSSHRFKNNLPYWSKYIIIGLIIWILLLMLLFVVL